jgi:hypothetical protein
MSQADLVARTPIVASPDVMGIRDLFEVDIIARAAFVSSPDSVAYGDNHGPLPAGAVVLPTIFGEFAATFAVPTMNATGTVGATASITRIPRRADKRGRRPVVRT